MTHPYGQGRQPQQPYYQGPPPPPGYPGSPGYGYSVPPKPPKKRTGLVVTLILGLVLVGVGGGTVAVMMLNQETQNREKALPPLTRLPLVPGGGPAPTYAGVRAPNACNLVPVDMLLGKGWKLSREVVTTERYPDPKSPVAQAVPESGGGPIHGISGCEVLFGGRAEVSLSIQTPPHDETSLMESTLRLAREDDTPYQQGDWEIIVISDDGGGTNHVSGVMWNGSTLVEFTVISPEGTARPKAVDTGKQVVSAVTERWSRAFVAPNVAEYPAPYGNVHDPCEAITGDDIAKLYGAPHSGMVDRTWSQDVIRLHKLDTGEPNEYVESTCHRAKLEPENSYDSASIEIDLRTFPSPRAAADELAFYADPNSEIGRSFGPARPLDVTIGDGPGYVSYAFAKERSIMFQVGRHVISLSAAENATLLDEEAMRTRLVPIAHQVASRLR